MLAALTLGVWVAAEPRFTFPVAPNGEGHSQPILGPRHDGEEMNLRLSALLRDCGLAMLSLLE